MGDGKLVGSQQTGDENEAKHPHRQRRRRPTQSAVRALLVILPVFLVILWNTLDANITLYTWDFLSSYTGNGSSSFEGKTIWITGGSSGIGAQLVCQLMASQQARHIIVSSRNPNRTAILASCNLSEEATRETKTTLSVLPFDALDFDADMVVQQALASAPTGSIDVLILNAGVYQVRPALMTSPEETRRIMLVNFQAPVAVATALVKHDSWKERGWGHLVVVSSLMGRGSNSLSSSYAASKHALRGYFHSLSAEESQWLRVDVAMPGATDTNLWKTNFVQPSAGVTIGGGGVSADSDSVVQQQVPSSPVAGKMAADRCARLILAGASGPHWLFYETWISKQPGLLWVYHSAYTPFLFHWLIHYFGKLRVDKWSEDGTDIVDVGSLLRQMFKA